MKGPGGGHVSAVAAAHDHHSIGIKVRPGLDPVEQGADIFHRVFTFSSIVEIQECFSISVRAPHVRPNDRSAELVQEAVVTAEKAGPKLALRSAMDHDDNGKFFCTGRL